MLIKESWCEIRNRGTDNEKRYLCGESDLYEPFTDNIKRLFLSLQREYGKCVSKVYIDDNTGKAKPIGWVFEKLVKYSDCNEYYLQETWIELHESQPDRIVKYHYHTI